ncbi:MAG: hypothetical protein ABL879_18950 [Devosia sp.]
MGIERLGDHCVAVPDTKSRRMGANGVEEHGGMKAMCGHGQSLHGVSPMSSPRTRQIEHAVKGGSANLPSTEGTNMMQRLLIGSLLALCLAVTPVNAEAAKVPRGIDAALMAKLKAGGLNIFFRHGLTPNHKDALDRDPDDPLPGNCSHQRNLSTEGIDQSRMIGEAFRELEIPLGIVRASPMCRSYDTAWYAFGRYERDRNMLLHGTEPANDPPEGKIWRNIQNIAKIPPLPMTNTVFVSHGTVGEVFGAGYLAEGEAVIVEPDGKGGWKVLARVVDTAWKAP